MHSLLNRILRKYLGQDFQYPEEWSKFINAVNEAFLGYEQDIRLLERSLDLSSRELIQANSDMLAIFKAIPDLFFRLSGEGTILEVKAGENAEFFMPPKSLIKKRIQEIVSPEVSEKFQHAVDQIKVNKEIIRFDYSVFVNGRNSYYETRFFPLLDDQIIAIIRDITEQKTAEEALRQSEERYKILYLELDKYKNHLEDLITIRTEKLRETEQRYTSIFSRAADTIIIFDSFGSILEVNEGACANLNYSSDELMRLSYLNIEEGINAESFSKLTNSIIENGSISAEAFHRKKDGSVFPVDSRCSCFMADYKYHFVMIARDISERKKKEEEIRKLYQAVVQSPATVVITDSRGIIEYVNPSFEIITGYSAAEAVNQKSNILNSGIHTEEFYTELWNTLNAGREWTGEFCNRKKNGELYWEHASISPVKNDRGIISHFVAVKLDITERKTLIKTLEDARQTAESATKIKSNFVANMSHEIRTPMNAIIGLTQLALKTELSGKQKDYLEKIDRASHSLLGIINDILDFSKIEEGKLNIENIGFYLIDVFSSVNDLLAPRIQKKGLVINYDFSSDVPNCLTGDPLRLEQILLNLISNAVKFTENGYISVSVSVKSEADDRITLLFSIKDTGIGIKEEDLPNLFSTFYQTDASITRKFGGTGLGLSITKHLTNLMGGEIWAESSLGSGSTFCFTIDFGVSKTNRGFIPPLSMHTRIERNKKVPSEHKEHFSKELRNIAGAHVLIVEDDEINRQVACEFLGSAGIKTDTAVNGQEAIDKIENGSAYDLIFMDLHMPDMDGFTASSLIREKLRCTFPIIALTADVVEGVKEKCLLAGMQDFLEKPIGKQKLHQCLLNWISPLSINKETGSSDVDTSYSRKNISSLPGISLEKGLINSNMNEELYRHLAGSFIKNYSVCYKEISDAFISGNRELAIRLAHTLKGSSSSIGAAEVSLRASFVENSLKSHEDHNVMVYLEELKNAISIAVGSLTLFLNNCNEHNSSSSISSEEFIVLMSKEDLMISNFDPDAISYLKNIAVPEEYRKDFEKLKEALESYDFSLAGEISSRIKNSIELNRK